MGGLKDWLTKAKIGIAVGKMVATGKPAKTLEKIEQGEAVAEKALEIFDLVKGLKKKKT